MSKVKVAINGMGRIGRTVLREFFERNETAFEIVAVNNPGKADQYVHLLKYDSVHGKFSGEIKLEGDLLNINGKPIKFYNIKDTTEIPWSDLGVQVVIDATGIFKDKEGQGQHMRGTVKKVIMCAPGKRLDGTFVMGVNSKSYDPAKHHIISNASGTTNCLAPIVKVLNDKFEIEIKSEAGYGQVNDYMIVNIPKSVFEVNGELDTEMVKSGNRLPMMTQDGNMLDGLVKEVNDDNVVMDFNHPLAGKDLYFEGEVIGVRDASENELNDCCGEDNCDECGHSH